MCTCTKIPPISIYLNGSSRCWYFFWFFLPQKNNNCTFSGRQDSNQFLSYYFWLPNASVLIDFRGFSSALQISYLTHSPGEMRWAIGARPTQDICIGFQLSMETWSISFTSPLLKCSLGCYTVEGSILSRHFNRAITTKIILVPCRMGLRLVLFIWQSRFLSQGISSIMIYIMHLPLWALGI